MCTSFAKSLPSHDAYAPCARKQRMYGMDEKDFDRNATQAVEQNARAEFLRAHLKPR